MPTPDETSAAVTHGVPVEGPVSSPAGSPETPAPDHPPTDIAASLTVLDGLAERPLYEHAAVYQGLHADLQAALAEIDGA